MSFPVLLSELTSFTGDLVFIPVNNPDFHWSLLVCECKIRKFYHYDTLHGANDYYVQDLVKDLLAQIHQNNQVDLNRYLIPEHDIHQGNGYDCGIAVISIIKRISEKYEGDMKNIDLGIFDFKKDREELRKKYLVEK
jgi:Ulp1 family protease